MRTALLGDALQILDDAAVVRRHNRKLVNHLLIDAMALILHRFARKSFACDNLNVG